MSVWLPDIPEQVTRSHTLWTVINISMSLRTCAAVAERRGRGGTTKFLICLININEFPLNVSKHTASRPDQKTAF